MREFIDKTKKEKLERLEEIIGFGVVGEARDILLRVRNSLRSDPELASLRGQRAERQTDLVEVLGRDKFDEGNIIDCADMLAKECDQGVKVSSLADVDGVLTILEKRSVKETKGQEIAKLVDQANEVTLTSPGGTDLKFSLEGRKVLIDDGMLAEKGAFGNLPSGEVYSAPLEGTANGILVVEQGWCALTEDLTLVFEDGRVTQVISGGKTGDELRETLACGENEEPYLSRRNCAELGIGTNPNARRIDISLEAEKIRKTVHIAVGDNSHMGGRVSADLHRDFVISKPTLRFDGKTAIKDGEIL